MGYTENCGTSEQFTRCLTGYGHLKPCYEEGVDIFERGHVDLWLLNIKAKQQGIQQCHL